VRIATMLEAQEDLRYDDILLFAKRVEDTGLHGLFRSDHYTSVAGFDDRGSTDAWATLAGLARETRRIHIGTLVSPVTFRRAGNLAKVVATVSDMAGVHDDGSSRVSLGMGAGWLEVEHRRHGFPFQDRAARFRRLEEQLHVVNALWSPQAQPFDYDGEFETLHDARFVPVPVPRPRIVVGGSGMRRTPRLAARYADELNGVFLSPAACAQQRTSLHEALRAEQRDPATVDYTLMTGCIVGATQAEFESRARRLQQRGRDQRPLHQWLADLAGTWVLGTVDDARRHLNALSEAGVDGVMLQHQLHDDLDMVDLIAGALAR
jgi:alkanesulfonate monooxygenase SsuD/methylene tetrahydromethanopterin reductase-like flavin-dependent oxidoreductase (luciferase family)